MLEGKIVFLNSLIKIKGKMVNLYILSRLTVKKRVKRIYLIYFSKVRESFDKKGNLFKKLIIQKKLGTQMIIPLQFSSITLPTIINMLRLLEWGDLNL